MRILYKTTIVHAEDMTGQEGLTAVSREDKKAEDDSISWLARIPGDFVVSDGQTKC